MEPRSFQFDIVLVRGKRLHEAVIRDLQARIHMAAAAEIILIASLPQARH